MVYGDTIVVPARRENFERRFLAKACWYPIRISDEMIDRIRYIAAYQTTPISAITHVAEVANIRPASEEEYEKKLGRPVKYRLDFAGPPRKIRPIGLPANPGTFVVPRGPRYTWYEKLEEAETLEDVFQGGS